MYSESEVLNGKDGEELGLFHSAALTLAFSTSIIRILRGLRVGMELPYD